MKYLLIVILNVFATSGLYSQTTGNITGPVHSGGSSTSMNSVANLPVELVGPNDLLGITVYDSPELTRTVRVDSDGTIRLPMLVKHVKAAGLYPEDLEKAIAGALVSEQIMVDPVVTVSVIEYRSRTITVVGAVKAPSTFQNTGIVNLLDAITVSGGLSENAGQEILVSRQAVDQVGQVSPQIKRISTQELLNGADPALNIALHSGDVVRVPEAGRFYVVGNVKTPGAYTIKDSSESVLKALALSQGLDRYSAHTAYIYRTEGGSGGKSEIAIDLKNIMDRKSPDVSLMANDILYIPTANGRKAALTALDRALIVGGGLGAAVLYVYH
jgi:polysaccharide biosynthesis/export protein